MSLWRMVRVGWWLQLKLRSRSAFDGALAVIWPLFFATSALLVVRAGHRGELASTAVGACVMGVWSATSTTAASSLQHERRLGTLELLAAAPRPFALVMLPLTLSMATIGGVSMLATLVWARLVFGVAVPIHSPLLLLVVVPLVVASIGMMGFLLSVVAVRYRAAWALGNATEYPVWLICGFLVPLSVLPGWVHPLSWALAPTWGVEALRASTLGGAAWTDIGVCALLAASYGLVGGLLAGALLRSARTHATLSLT